MEKFEKHFIEHFSDRSRIRLREEWQSIGNPSESIQNARDKIWAYANWILENKMNGAGVSVGEFRCENDPMFQGVNRGFIEIHIRMNTLTSGDNMDAQESNMRSIRRATQEERDEQSSLSAVAGSLAALRCWLSRLVRILTVRAAERNMKKALRLIDRSEHALWNVGVYVTVGPAEDEIEEILEALHSAND